MPRCPFCGEELEYVEVECYDVWWAMYEVYPDDDSHTLTWDCVDKELSKDSRIERVGCPNCYSTLPLKDEDEIEEFFEGSLIIAPLNDPRIRVLNEKRVLFNGKLYELRRTHELVRDHDGIVREPFTYDKPEQRFTVLVLSEL